MLKVLLLSLSRQYTVDGQYIPSLFIEPEVRHDKTSYILDIFLCEHQLEVRDLLLQQFLHQTNWSFYKSLSQMLECSYLNKM